MAEQDPDFFFNIPVSAAELRRRAALDDGLAHGSHITPRDPLPGEPVTLTFHSNASRPIDQVAVYYTTSGAEPAGMRGSSASSDVALAQPGELISDPAAGERLRVWQATIPGQPDGTLVRYRADGWSLDNDAGHWYADNVNPIGQPPVSGQVFAYSVDRFRPPTWFDDAVIYQIFVDRFATGEDERPLSDPGSISGIFGGTLRGVLEKLDYIQALGITCIWLTPVFESPSAHGYDPADHYHVAERVGGDAALQQLIEAAHARGMRVLLDFVANHTSHLHPQFQQALADPSSKAAKLYTIGAEWPAGYAAYFNVATMPELATDQPEAQRHLIDSALDWLSRFGADGLRLDYVTGPSHAFWATFHHGVKGRYPEAVTLGEIGGPLDDFALYAGRIDAFMDFPLAHLMRRVFARRTASLTELLTYLEARGPQLPAEMSRATVLDNHDMHRFLWLAQGDSARLKLAATCQMTLPGAPIVYYGTEVGLSQADDAYKENAFARAPMIWGAQQDPSIHEHFARLIALRAAHPALRSGALTRLEVQAERAEREDRLADAHDQVGAYLRVYDDDVVVVVLNNAEHPVKLRVSTGGHVVAPQMRNALAPAGDGAVAVINGEMRLDLPPLSAALLLSNP